MKGVRQKRFVIPICKGLIYGTSNVSCIVAISGYILNQVHF